jgi:hypothetical protein
MRQKDFPGRWIPRQTHLRYAFVILGNWRYWQAKAVSELRANQEKQRLLRKEVSNIQQRALANDPIALNGNQTTPSVCGVMSR